MHQPYSTIRIILIGMLVTAPIAACNRGDSARNDSALARDLNLIRSDSSVMVVSPEERMRLDSARARAGIAAGAASARRSYRSSSGDVARSAPATAPAPTRTRIVKHTERDAAIGAVAGAVIGGVTHGAKGAVIGGASGAVLGGIIGNNVDKKRKRP